MDIEKVSEIVRELGGVAGYEQHPASYRVNDDSCEIMFTMDLDSNGSRAIFLHYTDGEVQSIPDHLARRYVEAKLNVIRVAAEAFEFRETV